MATLFHTVFEETQATQSASLPEGPTREADQGDTAVCVCVCFSPHPYSGMGT